MKAHRLSGKERVSDAAISKKKEPIITDFPETSATVNSASCG